MYAAKNLTLSKLPYCYLCVNKLLIYEYENKKGASQRSRRGSDSSSEGFHEVMGAEKWYIGGRTANGEEKFYKLGMVKRHRSADRLSLDKLSI